MAKNKKEKTKARKKAERVGKAIEANTADMAHKIWLAGVGAYGKAYDKALANANKFNKQSSDVFDDLVKRGEEIENEVRERLATNETVAKAGQSVAKYAEAARDFQAQARDEFEARMERMRDLLGVKDLGKKGNKLAAKIDKLEDEVAETVAKARGKAKERNSDLKDRISRLTAEIESVAGEATAGYTKTTKKAAKRTTKAVKEAMAKPEKAKKTKKSEKPAVAEKAAPAKPAAAKATPAKATTSDDLTMMTGVGPALAKKLNAAGITSFAQIAAMTKAEAEKLDETIAARGRVLRDEWVKQAKVLKN
ncbi:phasin family protein [Hyphomonas pacifica]|uniref:Uncharacterized protein n=1 Tax=Hyphomonas pacifica TaxID=1280941 RepID=A0A062U272_9PROT|nr:phasin family protein [Hyphomonas pacifica]KCZ50694.1 hypothetical protein HY2_02245 [Hyphomonas pacifica]RAN30974.1 hypothetical protein HY3_05080 [Hyphomonas pacifica]RAN34912.1 hypothetical protein HY11_02645 [Hyphomonas pacifica]